jgi:hypothetical protein
MFVSVVTLRLLLLAKLPCEFFADILCMLRDSINSGWQRLPFLPTAAFVAHPRSAAAEQKAGESLWRRYCS